MSIRRKPHKLYIPVGIVSACFFMGCASSGKSVAVSDEHQNHRTLVEHAWQEREAAFEQVTHAIAGYCKITSESIVARQRCIIDKQRELDGIRVLALARSHTMHMGKYGDDRQTGHLVHCEGHGRQTICDRRQPVIADVLLNDRKQPVAQ
jgi:hypothetical protein